ncbi:GntR family transcriptional regulator [Shimia isoporae]|uniref:GntR family transcriptional regulator n=1 Tax=Shimia isoporae TaxID=647720 RepID=A0A4R1NPV9_9RHOB|nr:GntR family transcriptional regulator [Shimia isoporae]TCL10275.1 GntR family transcriptional regulator [Shimia isoporae]
MNVPIQSPTHSPPQSATEQVFQALHASIVDLSLEPGSKVSEAEIANRMDVSRQPVRDAFFRLSQLGFLQIRPQRATLVSRISLQAVESAAFVRTALETACLSEAINRLTTSDLEHLNMLTRAQENAVSASDGTRFFSLDEDFHLAICRIAGREDIWPLIREQKSHMDRARHLSLPDNGPAALAEHKDIVGALGSRDETAARERLSQHLFSLMPIFEDIRAKNPNYFEDRPK